LLTSTSLHLHTAKISIIIPARDEAENIKVTLATTQASTDVETIVVDGGSKDNTVEMAKSLGAKVITSAAGRACRMNTGAKDSSGDILLFLHADTRLPVGFDCMVRTTLARPGIVAGAFALRIDAPLGEKPRRARLRGPRKSALFSKFLGFPSPASSLRLVEWGANMRSRFLQMPYGDQAIFLTKQTFHHIGGFPELPIMEDFELMRRLRNLGKIAIVPTPVVTSARRWLQKGVWQTTVLNQLIIIAYFLGVSPEQLYHWYRHENLCYRKKRNQELET